MYRLLAPANTTSLDPKFNPKLSPSVVKTKSSTKDGKDLTSDVIKAIEKRLEKKYKMKFTKGYTSDPELRRDDPRYTKAEIAGMEDSENDPKDDWTPEDEEEQVRYDKGWYGESLKETASKLGYLKNE